MRAYVLGLALVIACMMHVSPVRASGVACPVGAYARLAGERTLVVWDAANHREHFVQKAWFEGDPRSFGYFVPTPTPPVVAKESDEVIDKVASLVDGDVLPVPEAPGGGGDVMQRVRIDGFEVVSIDASALGAWLDKNGCAQDRAVLAWANTYAKGWVINAVRYAPQGEAARRAIETPTLRFSFATDVPIYPYAEPPNDKAAEAAFYKRYGSGCVPGDPLCVSNQGRFLTRPLDVYLIAPRQMQATIDHRTGGPSVVAAVLCPTATLEPALGDTSAWDFDAGANDAWAITHLSEQRLDRHATTDVTFASFDLPPPRPLEGLDPNVLRAWNAPPNGALAPAPAKAEPSAPNRRRHHLAALLAILLAGIVAWSLVSEREKQDHRA